MNTARPNQRCLQPDEDQTCGDSADVEGPTRDRKRGLSDLPEDIIEQIFKLAHTLSDPEDSCYAPLPLKDARKRRRHGTLRRICQVSHQFHRIASPLLYPWGKDDRLGRRASLYKTNTAQDDHETYIRQVVVEIRSSDPDEANILTRNVEGVKELRLELGSGSTELGFSTSDYSKLLESMPRLESIIVASEMGIEKSEVLCLLAMPTLRNFELWAGGLLADKQSRSYPKRGFLADRLTIGHFYMIGIRLYRLLKAFRALKYFRYALGQKIPSHGNGRGQTTSVSLYDALNRGSLNRALQQHCESLEELHIEALGNGSPNWPGKVHFNAEARGMPLRLGDFTKLKVFTFPYRPLAQYWNAQNLGSCWPPPSSRPMDPVREPDSFANYPEGATEPGWGVPRDFLPSSIETLRLFLVGGEMSPFQLLYHIVDCRQRYPHLELVEFLVDDIMHFADRNRNALLCALRAGVGLRFRDNLDADVFVLMQPRTLSPPACLVTTVYSSKAHVLPIPGNDGPTARDQQSLESTGCERLVYMLFPLFKAKENPPELASRDDGDATPSDDGPDEESDEPHVPRY